MMILGAVLMTCAAAAQDPPANAEARETLRSFRLSIDFREMPLSAALDYLRDATGLNIALDSRVDARRAISLRVRDLPLRTVLKLVLDPLDLGGVLREGVLRIVPREAARGALEVRIYDVRDLLATAPDFPGPRLDLSHENELRFTSFIPEPPQSVFSNEGTLLDLVRSGLSGGRWDDGADAALTNGFLIVTQTRAAHGEISGLLERLRMFR